MDFSLTDEQLALQESVRRFARRELPEIAAEVEQSDEPPNLALRKRFAELGYLGVNLAREYGGAGLSHLDAVLVLEELASVSIAVAFPVFESCFGPTLAIAHFGSEEMRQRLLPAVCAGDNGGRGFHVRTRCRLGADRSRYAGPGTGRRIAVERY